MKKLLLTLTAILFAFTAHAQTADDKWWIDIDLINNKFDYRYYESLFNFGDLGSAGFRVGVDRYLNNSLDLELGTSYGKLSHENIFVGNVFDVDARLVYKLANGYVLKEESKVAPFRVINIGNSNPTTLIDFISAIEKSTGIRAAKNFMPMQTGDMLATWADISYLKKLTDYQPKISFKDGVDKFVSWYREYYSL